LFFDFHPATINSITIMTAELQKEFRNRYGEDAEHVFFCPGRVNLIGEHIDYNGGRVLPCAISKGTWLAISRNTEKKLRFHSLDFPETIELNLQTSYSKTGKEWFNYPLGVINEILQEGHGISGLNLLYKGNLPVAAGLSSSASIEVATAFAISEIFGLNISRPEIALLCKKVENRFIEVNSGIMDQFAVAMGSKGNAILLNCDTLEYEYIPFEPGEYRLVIINSNKERKLADSKYNERFAECGAALRLLKQDLNVRHLCDISPKAFVQHQHLLGDEVLLRRARHVITENERVKKAVKALRSGNIKAFGKLLYASHQSLKTDYEVSGMELDAIVEFSSGFKSCTGARMTGAGFGGCAIALVLKEDIGQYSKQLTAFYKNKIGYEPGIFESEIGNGVSESGLP
jgi:galactokinase